jgi:PucR C-terminal helix-turn-helix domain
MDSYVEAVLGKLVSYDHDRGAGLMEFLHALVEVNFNTSRVARMLSIHLNTAKYRRRRIEELLEVGLDDPNVRFSVQLALKLLAIHDLLEPGATAGTFITLSWIGSRITWSLSGYFSNPPISG